MPNFRMRKLSVERLNHRLPIRRHSSRDVCKLIGSPRAARRVKREHVGQSCDVSRRDNVVRKDSILHSLVHRAPKIAAYLRTQRE